MSLVPTCERYKHYGTSNKKLLELGPTYFLRYWTRSVSDTGGCRCRYSTVPVVLKTGKQAWTEAGGNKPDLGDEFDCARFIGLTIKFSNKQENDIIYIASVYHPHDQLNPLLLEQFHDKLDN
jgi:hypothetical protein